ncbi:MAG TPA: amidohydrolase, partial [Candidatus Binatia bacterium]|nr:amidohydrolase [Candidatus Binatia bacterium]
MSRDYRYFSADSHFECLPEIWTHRVPTKYRDRAPHRIKLADGRDAIVEEGQPLEYRGTNLFAGKPL